MANLYHMDSPINREQRNNVNATFQDIQQEIGKVVIKTGEVKDYVESNLTGLQSQIDTLVVEGDSSPEAAQARLDNEGVEHPTLKNRIDSDVNKTDKKIDGVEKHLVPKNNVFGGQLAKLKYALSDPLEQFMSVVFIGDSITWGLSATGNATDQNVGRDGTLSDRRDYFTSLSWVNLLKRYIGDKYMFGASPALSNWQASPSGNSIVEYSRQIKLFPRGGDFNISKIGTVTGNPETTNSPSSLLGAQYSLRVGSLQNGVYNLSFNFSGKEFTLSFDSVVDSMRYELFVNGLSQGVFSTVPGEEGVTAGYDRRRTHTFPYVKDALIEIKTVLNPNYSGTQTLKLGGILINKKVKISNQGIIGATVNSYVSRNLDGNSSGDGVAIGEEDNYVFVQLGTNDRLNAASIAKGPSDFKNNLYGMLRMIESPKRNIVLMCSNPVSNESSSTYSFTMQDTRDTIFTVSKEEKLDMIDNYSIFGDTNPSDFTKDGLHPNDQGHKIIFRNIVNSIESCSYLDDNGGGEGINYSTGVWTPYLGASTVDGNHIYSEQQGSYVKVGRQVTAYFRVVVSSKGSDISGNVLLRGLPFASDIRASVNLGQYSYVELGTGYTQLSGIAIGSYIQLNQMGSGKVFVNINQNAISDGFLINGSVSYTTTQ